MEKWKGKPENDENSRDNVLLEEQKNAGGRRVFLAKSVAKC